MKFAMNYEEIKFRRKKIGRLMNRNTVPNVQLIRLISCEEALHA